MISCYPMPFYRSFSSDDQRRWDLPKQRRIPWAIIGPLFLIAVLVFARLHSA